MVLKCRFRPRLLSLSILAIISLVCLYTNVPHPEQTSIDNILNSKFQSFKSKSTDLSLICSGEPFQRWCTNQVTMCNTSIVIFDQLFFLTRTIFLQPNLAKGQRKGGEEMKDVINQPESIEYFKFETGFIKTPCTIPLGHNLLKSRPGDHLLNVLTSATPYEIFEINPKSTSTFHFESQTTIAVNRQDYANFYHTITDLFTVYLLCRFFERDPKSVQILFLDAHPKGSLDQLWSILFHSYQRLGRMKYSTIFYRELIWSQSQPRSELDVDRQRTTPPIYFENFREHFIQQFQLEHLSNISVNCQQLNIFFLIRRNYVAHPRNPSGRIRRQLTNEREILDELTTNFQRWPSINFTSGYFEQATLHEQLSIILQSDILVGMHGAGLTHVLFLQANRSLVELAAEGSHSLTHFKQMAAINKIKYRQCSIINGISTTAQTIFKCITDQLFQMCPMLNMTAILSTEKLAKNDSTMGRKSG